MRDPDKTNYNLELVRIMAKSGVSREDRRRCIERVNTCLGRFFELPKSLYDEVEKMTKTGLNGKQIVQRLDNEYIQVELMTETYNSSMDIF